MARDDHKITYAASGVDIDAGNEAAKKLLPHARSTHSPAVMTGTCDFGALFKLDLGGIKQPVLVSGTDGVGSKLKIAFMMQKHDTVGIDCVAMNADDVVCSGARPLFLLDYLGVGKVKPDVVAEIVKGFAQGCRQAGCALVGGETAELPDFYGEDEYDLAGFCVGVVDEDRIIDGLSVRPGDVIVGMASSGLHSNGFSLARRVLLGQGALKIDSYVPELARTVGEEMLEPTRVYAKAIVEVLEQVKIKGLAHITGGGFYDNIPRCMAPGTRALIVPGTWPVPPVFDLIAQMGPVDREEMHRVFNMGIGMVAIVDAGEVVALQEGLRDRGHDSYVIGEVIAGEKGVDIAWED
jgi:phosphoribosylformylglycinamidine cyclo-ligase